MALKAVVIVTVIQALSPLFLNCTLLDAAFAVLYYKAISLSGFVIFYTHVAKIHLYLQNMAVSGL